MERELLLLDACKEGDVIMVRHLLHEAGADPNERDEQGRTPLLMACSFNRVNIARLLLDMPDIQPDVPDDQGCTPLQRACRNAGPELIQMLGRDQFRGIDTGPAVEAICRELGKTWILELIAARKKQKEEGEDQGEADDERLPQSWMVGWWCQVS